MELIINILQETRKIKQKHLQKARESGSAFNLINVMKAETDEVQVTLNNGELITSLSLDNYLDLKNLKKINNLENGK